MKVCGQRMNHFTKPFKLHRSFEAQPIIYLFICHTAALQL